MPSSPIGRVRLPDGQGGTKWYQDSRIEDFDVTDTVAGEISEFEVLLANEDGGLNHIEPGDEIKIEMSDDGGSTWEHIVLGRIASPRSDISTEGVYKRISGENFGVLLEDREMSEVFTNITIKQLINEIIQKFIPELTIAVNNAPTTTIDKILLPNFSVKQAIDKIESLIDEDFVWFVDQNKGFHFEEEGYSSSGKTLEYGENIVEASIGLDESRLVNFAQVFGRNQRTRKVEDVTFSGSQETFWTEFKPNAVRVENTSANITLSGGIEGIDQLSDAGIDYLVDQQNKEITVDTQPNGDNGEISYSRGHPIFAIRRDAASISEHGIHKRQIMGEAIDEQSIARNLAEKIVSKFSEPLLIGDVTIAGIINLKAGTTVDVKVPSQGIDDTLVVQEVQYDYSSEGFTQDVVLNEKLGEVEEIVQDHEERIRTLEGEVSGSLELVPKFVFPSETAAVTETGKVETADINETFYLDRVLLGEHHLFSTQQDTETEKGWDRGTYTGDATTSNQIGAPHTPRGVDASNYCDGGSPNSNYEWIDRIEIKDSDGNVLVDNQSGQNGGYLDATDKIAEAEPGEQLTITWHIGGSGGFTEYLSWNSDFDNPGNLSKEADLHSEVQPFTFTHTITVPQNEGDYMIRLQCDYSSFAYGPCSMGGYGEYEDYTVSVVAQKPNPQGTESLTLGSFNGSGTWEVDVPYNKIGVENSWETIEWTETEPSGTSASVNVKDSGGNYLAQDISSGTDLSTISGTKKEDLTIEIELQSDSDSVPEIDDLKINFTPALIGDQSSNFNTVHNF